MDHLLYGVAYYDEYMPYERLEEDMRMMKEAGINTIRIAESTWSSEEPEEGVFDFTHVRRVLRAAEKEGLHVIVGTPTYAIPPWLAKLHPEVLAITEKGAGRYGARQIMDITSPAYLYYAERVIRKLMEAVQPYSCVIGFQLDNETKHYDTAGPNVQQKFVRYLRDKFGSIKSMNRAFGLNYWSNRVDSWENFPDVLGTINGSLAAEFEKFQRTLVTDFLQWQADIVEEYRREDQFVTQNFDFDWKEGSYGVQPRTDHFAASRCLTVAGVDIYHPTQSHLTGAEIAMGGDMIRSLMNGNYLLLETEAQGFPQWLPYPGQLRLQAFSHLASGSDSVMYWHWHSIHNACETYWKGLLSHDFQPNETYLEGKTIGADFRRLSSQLVHLKKQARVAILVSNEALTAMKYFPLPEGVSYNDVMRWLYDSLYEMNVECDFLYPQSENLEDYDLIVVPALYAAPDELLQRLNRYVEEGGHLVVTFKSGFCNDMVKVSHERQPHFLSECCGITYNQFTIPENVTFSPEVFDLPEEDRKLHCWMELVVPTEARVLAWYQHPAWGKYAAVTENCFGKGRATYLASMMEKTALKRILRRALEKAELWETEQQAQFPVILRQGVNQEGKRICYYLHYSGEEREQPYLHPDGVELLSGQPVKQGQILHLAPWDVKIFEF